MIKTLLYLAAFLTLFTLEVSFIHALPTPLDRMPLVITGVVFLYLYVDFPAVLWWLIFHGILLQVFALSFTPFQLIAYIAAAAVTVLASRHVFSNRSFYGVASTTALAVATILFVEITLSLGGSFFGQIPVPFGTLLHVRLWGIVLSALALLLLFPLSTKLRGALHSLFQHYT